MTTWSRFKEIKKALDIEDIEGLLGLGSPSDEYDGEAALIESGLAKITNFGQTLTNAEQVEAIIFHVWNEQFGPFEDGELNKRQPAFASVAKKLTTA